ncbi:hypothetical protein F4860DRAFT_510861 [Xylaria cubensis]|nr:hypothetical protein F4860DRAFT_510861 [Xylaria cubensis]
MDFIRDTRRIHDCDPYFILETILRNPIPPRYIMTGDGEIISQLHFLNDAPATLIAMARALEVLGFEPGRDESGLFDASWHNFGFDEIFDRIVINQFCTRVCPEGDRHGSAAISLSFEALMCSFLASEALMPLWCMEVSEDTVAFHVPTPSAILSEGLKDHRDDLFSTNPLAYDEVQWPSGQTPMHCRLLTDNPIGDKIDNIRQFTIVSKAGVHKITYALIIAIEWPKLVEGRYIIRLYGKCGAIHVQESPIGTLPGYSLTTDYKHMFIFHRIGPLSTSLADVDYAMALQGFQLGNHIPGPTCFVS